MSYRVELASTGRATCSATHCYKEGTKIEKGALRQGTLVTINEHSSLKWRHWGCVTPKVLANWKEASGMDMELIDGYAELPPKAQEKVKRALEQVHVDDEDWNGDVEMNRYNPDKPMQGMFVKQTPKKKGKKDDDGDEADASPSKKPATKKRGRAKKDDDDDDDAEPAPKKAKGTKKKAAKAEEPGEPEPVKAPKKPAGGKKTKAVEDEQSDDKPAPAPKKGRGKKAKSAETVSPLDDEVSDVEEVPVKKGRAKKGTAKPVKSSDDVEDSPEPKKQPQKRGKKAAKA